MSTAFEIGRWPALIRRDFSHAGDGPIRASRKSRPMYRGQPGKSSIWTLTGSGVAGRSGSRPGGGFNSALKTAATSRAIP